MTALLAMVLFLTLMTLLVWRIYEHHESSRYGEDQNSAITLPV